MSGHLVGCVKALKDIGKSHKLAMVAFADSADDRTHIAFPGADAIQEWASCSRSRASELVRDLIELGLLELYRTARPGRRAEYIVFPGGCCDLHRIPVPEPDVGPDVDALAKAAGITADQARALLEAMNSTPAVDIVQADHDEPAEPSNGSEIPDMSPLNGSEISDPFQPVAPETVDNPVENAALSGEWVQNGSEISDPFTSFNNTPQPPTASRQGNCPKHPNGHASCRACGTSPRAAAKAAGRAAAGAAREREQQRIRAQRAAEDAQRAADALVERKAAAARAAIAANRDRAQEHAR